jgi:5-methylcytosine-specific restriction endonuclease McrA
MSHQQSRINAAECRHQRQSLKRYPLSNGTFQVRSQCDECGLLNGMAISRSKFQARPESLPWVDQQRAEDAKADKLNHSIDAASDREAKRREEWFKKYDEYLKSEKWAKKREMALLRDKGVCQGCFFKKATEVHHLTYGNWGDELIFQLVSLCHDCHIKVHTTPPPRLS